MVALDGKITIEKELRPCIVDSIVEHSICSHQDGSLEIITDKTEQRRALFHVWMQGKAIVEYEDGSIHEVKPTQIRFVDNAIRGYPFPQMENRDV